MMRQLIDSVKVLNHEGLLKLLDDFSCEKLFHIQILISKILLDRHRREEQKQEEEDSIMI
jgi:hypothetical protein